MMTRRIFPLLLMAACTAVVPPAAWSADFELRLDRLTDAFSLLPQADRMTTDEVVALIRRGEHSEALARLNKLNAANPENSSLRVLTAYALLQVGNLVGALDEAKLAHHATNGNSYKCWFLSKIALLNGDTAICKRELTHAKEAGDLRAETKALEQELKKRKN